MLVARLADPDPATWKATVEALAARGPGAVPALVNALEHEHRAVREGAAHALGDLGPAAAPAVPALMRRVEFEGDDFALWKAIRALGRIGPAAAPALDLLRPFAEDPRHTEILRASAQTAVRQIEGE